ncbi:MAG: hypothetical protein AAF961_18290, partial [Planctomycetota bacterium]
MIRRALAFVAVALTSSAVIQSAQGDEQIEWNFAEGDVPRFEMTQRMRIDIEAPDIGPTSSDAEQKLDFLWKVEAMQPDGSAVVALSVDRAQLQLEMHGGQKVEYDTRSKEPLQGFAAVIGPTLEVITSMPLESTISSRGKVTEMEVPEELSEALKNAPGASLM